MTWPDFYLFCFQLPPQALQAPIRKCNCRFRPGGPVGAAEDAQ